MTRFSKFVIYGLLLVLIGGVAFVGITYNRRISSSVKSDRVANLKSRIEDLENRLSTVKKSQGEQISSVQSRLDKLSKQYTTISQKIKGGEKMGEVNNLLILVNSGPEKAYNQYASYVVAFMAKKLAGVEEVTLFYGPQGVEMSKKGQLTQFKIEDSVKELIAGQLEGVEAGDLPEDLEGMARFVSTELGVEIASCGTFHVIDGFASQIEDKSNIEEFITPVKLPQAADTMLSADRIFYY